MYPVLFSVFGYDVHTYGVCIATGLVLCILFLYFLIKRHNIAVSVFDTYITAALVSILLGFFSALFFQTVYNCQQTGRWEWGGMTFMGGLVGGVCVFVLYFLLFIRQPKMRQAFFDIADFAVPCIFIAHALGRVGCFFSGCCYGVVTDSTFWGVDFHIDTDPAGTLRYPTQLFEAAFLFVMFLITAIIAIKRKKRGYMLSLYLFSYGVWRFFIEFLRGDNRGGFVGATLSPSQIQAIIFVSAAALYLVAAYILEKKGILLQNMDWSQEIKQELAVAEEKRKFKEEMKAKRNEDVKSYEEYSDQIEKANKEIPKPSPDEKSNE